MTATQPAPSRRPRQRGQALVEFALIIPIFFGIVLALAEGGAFAWTLNAIEHAAQEGGRLAALPETADEAEVKDRILVHAAVSLATVTADDITITVSGCSTSPCNFATRATGDRVGVSIAYTYRPLLSVVFGAATFNMSAVTEYRVE